MEAGNHIAYDRGDFARKRRRTRRRGRSEGGEGGRVECVIKSRDREKEETSWRTTIGDGSNVKTCTLKLKCPQILIQLNRPYWIGPAGLCEEHDAGCGFCIPTCSSRLLVAGTSFKQAWPNVGAPASFRFCWCPNSTSAASSCSRRTYASTEVPS